MASVLLPHPTNVIIKKPNSEFGNVGIAVHSLLYNSNESKYPRKLEHHTPGNFQIPTGRRCCHGFESRSPAQVGDSSFFYARCLVNSQGIPGSQVKMRSLATSFGHMGGACDLKFIVNGESEHLLTAGSDCMTIVRGVDPSRRTAEIDGDTAEVRVVMWCSYIGDSQEFSRFIYRFISQCTLHLTLHMYDLKAYRNIPHQQNPTLSIPISA